MLRQYILIAFVYNVPAGPSRDFRFHERIVTQYLTHSMDFVRKERRGRGERERTIFQCYCQQSRPIAFCLYGKERGRDEKGRERKRGIVCVCRAKCLAEMTYNCCLSGTVRSQLLHSSKRSCSISGRGTPSGIPGDKRAIPVFRAGKHTVCRRAFPSHRRIEGTLFSTRFFLLIVFFPPPPRFRLVIAFFFLFFLFSYLFITISVLSEGHQAIYF